MTIPTTTLHEGCGFPHTQVARLIQALRQARFSGQIDWSSADRNQWSFYFHRGCLCYATGGTHKVRRWARTLAVQCPQLQINLAQFQQNLHQTTAVRFSFGWEYDLLDWWVEQQQLTPAQAAQTIQAIFSEVLFDLLHAPDLTYQIKRLPYTPKPLTVLDEQKAFLETQRLWQNLRRYNIAVEALNKAPVVKSAQLYRGLSPAQQSLLQLLDGEKTLRDLAVQTRVDVVQMVGFLLPYIQSDQVDLLAVADLPEPVQPEVSRRVSPAVNHPLIACVDDSTIVGWTMEKLLTTAGYQFIGINDGFRAITTLLQRKPSLIFLDVFMPGTNGYEICRTLRKAPSFQQTPIVFLTGLDGVVDQVRARLAGASDFLSKPIDAEQVLHITAKYLSKAAVV